MAAIGGPPIIPDKFLRFDTRVSADDHFLNMRDLKTARENLNILLARRARWPLCCITYTGTAADLGYRLLQLGRYGNRVNLIMQQVVQIPYYAPTVQISVYGKATASSAGPYLYPMIAYNNTTEIQYSNGAQHTSGTGLEQVQLQLDVPEHTQAQASQFGFVIATIGVAVECVLAGADVADDETVVIAGSDWVITNATTPGFEVGDFIYVNGFIDFTLRRVLYASDDNNESYYRVASPWSYVPQVDDVMNGQELVGYVPDTITAWADRATVLR